MSFSYLSSPFLCVFVFDVVFVVVVLWRDLLFGSWLWLFLVRVICFAYHSHPAWLGSARLSSTGPLLAYALCYSCGLALVTCKFLLLPFVFAFVLFPVSNNQKLLPLPLPQPQSQPATRQTEPNLCATRNRHDSCCCCCSGCLCWHVAEALAPFSNLSRDPSLWFYPPTHDCWR